LNSYNSRLKPKVFINNCTNNQCTTSEHHHTQMHDRLLQLGQEHLTIQLRIPEGTTVHRADTSSVGQYSWLPKFSDLGNWHVNLVVLLEVTQYGDAQNLYQSLRQGKQSRPPDINLNRFLVPSPALSLAVIGLINPPRHRLHLISISAFTYIRIKCLVTQFISPFLSPSPWSQ
jgi:hypothetical protein